ERRAHLAIAGKDPVLVAQCGRRRDHSRLFALAAHVETDATLALQLEHPAVDQARPHHGFVDAPRERDVDPRIGLGVRSAIAVEHTENLPRDGRRGTAFGLCYYIHQVTTSN